MRVDFPLKSPLTEKQWSFIQSSLASSFIDLEIHSNSKIFWCEYENHLDEQKIKTLVKKLLFICNGIVDGTIFHRGKGEGEFAKDPLPYLIDTRQVIDVGPGLFQFQGEFLTVFKAVDQYFLRLALNEFNAIEQENPTLWPIELFRKINYLNEFPHQAILTTGLKQNHKVLHDFSLAHDKTANFNSVRIDENFEEARYGLQPAVCDHCYFGLRGLSNVENSIYTTQNKVFRNEFSEFNSLDRLCCFTVRDIIFVGKKNFVLEIRQRLLDALAYFFDETGLEFSIETADDPFFTNNYEKKLVQHSFELKYEILVKIPFITRDIAVGSINLHLDTFGQAFDISTEDEKLFSGCIGIGFERLLLAFYSQFGTKIEKWPVKLKSLLGLT